MTAPAAQNAFIIHWRGGARSAGGGNRTGLGLFRNQLAQLLRLGKSRYERPPSAPNQDMCERECVC